MATSQFPPDPEGNVLEAQREDWAIPSEIAGVKIPDSDLAHGIMDLVRGESAPIVFNHAVRTYVLGELIGRSQRMTFDSELLFLGAICHDLGQTERYIGNQQFEIEGADAAVELLREKGVGDDRTAIVWDAIALHGAFAIVRRKQPEIALVSMGALADFVGMNTAGLDAEAIDELMRAIPRHGMKHNYKRVLIEMARRRPVEVTSGTHLGELARTHIPGFEPLRFETLIDAAPYDE